MKNFSVALVFSLFLHSVKAAPTTASGDNKNIQRRDANTCGDPTVAVTYVEAFKTSVNAHAFDILPNFVNVDTVKSDSWQIDGPAFRAWLNPGQPSTVPLYYLYNPTTSDYDFLISQTSSPPSRTGYNAAVIVGYVYPTQICSSVPLYSVFQPDDHWYTTNEVEHNFMVVNLGWSDGGIIAYVLPFDDVSEIVV